MRIKTNITCLNDIYALNEFFDDHEHYWGIPADPLEHLPKFESRKEYLTRVHGNMWDLQKFDHGWHWKIPYWKLAVYIINSNINKSFSLSFSYYCKQVDSQFQKYFLEQFEPRKYRRWNYYYNYFIDDNGLIQRIEIPKRKKKLTLTDFKNDITWEYYGKNYTYYRDKAEFEDYRKKNRREWKIYNLQIKLEKYQKYFKERKLKDKQRKHEQRINKTIK